MFVYYIIIYFIINLNCYKNLCMVYVLMNNFLYFFVCDEYEYYYCLGINMMIIEYCLFDKIFNLNILNCVNEFVFNEDI